MATALEGSLRRTTDAVADRALAARAAGEVMRTEVADLALWLAVDAEDVLVGLAARGARALAEERGLGVVPTVDDAGVDAAAPALVGFAESLAAAAEQASRSGVRSAFDQLADESLGAVADRVEQVAVNAGRAAAARMVGLVALQQFGTPYCPCGSCYGHDRRVLDESTVSAVGAPPYGDDCNCTVAIG